MEQLIHWSKEVGITVHPDVDLLKSGKYGTCGTATSDIPTETELCSIPFSACITPHSSCTELSIDFEEIKTRDLEAAVLAAYLIHHKRDPQSRWQAYLSSLPTTFSTPLFWTPEDLKWLEGTNLQNEEARRKDRVLEQVKSLSLIFESHEVAVSLPESLDPWIWAFSIIHSRSFPSSLITSDTENANHSVPDAPREQSHPILLPVMDTFNHKSPHAITWITDRDAHCIRFISGLSIRNTEEIFNNYGGKSNEDFLMSYGFCVEGVPSDHVSLKIPGSETRYYITRTTPLPEPLILAARGVRTGSERDEGHGRSMMEDVSVFRQLHEAVEGKVRTLLSSAPREAPKNGNQKNAQIYRDGQVELCRLCMHCIKARVTSMLERRERQVFTIDKVFRDAQFGKAVSDLLDVHDVMEVMESGLESIVMTLFVWCELKRAEDENVGNFRIREMDETEQLEVKDCWESIAPRFEVEPSGLFVGIDERSFAASWVIESDSAWSWDEEEPLIWIDPFNASGEATFSE